MMIGYFVGSGDTEVGKIFTPYLWGEKGLATLLEPLKDKNYDGDLRLLLIEYYIEGKFSKIFDLEAIKIRNYSNKNKDISVKVPVTRSSFQDRDENGRRKYLVHTTLNAVELVEKRLTKKKLN